MSSVESPSAGSPPEGLPAAVPPRAATPVKPGPIVLSPRISGARAFDAVARACLAHADANEPLIDVHGDHEAVHQFRVAYRRLRSLFSLCRAVARTDPEAARVKAGLRELTVAFGPARDLDVFSEAHRVVHPGADSPAAPAPADAADRADDGADDDAAARGAPRGLTAEDGARLELARAAAYRQAEEFLRSDAWRQTRADLDRWLAAGRVRAALPTQTWSARATAAEAMDRRRRRIIMAGADLFALDPHERHQVRIEAKKLRYGAQFFGSLWPRERAAVKQLESALSQLQDELGALNDAATWAHLVELAQLRDTLPPEVDTDAHLARAQGLVAKVADLRPFWQRPGPVPAADRQRPGG